jgi:hypothetical protein
MSRDLMAEARRRLPPEVDVVTLVSGGLVAGAVALGGCGSTPVRAADAADAASSKTHVVAVTRELLGRLAAVGAYRRPPRAAWSSCDDLGGKVAYRVSGRADARTGSPDGFLDAVRRSVGEAGFELTEVSTTADSATWQGEHDDVRVQLTGYAGQPAVLLSLTGPCLDVGDADEGLLAEAPERLDLG